MQEKFLVQVRIQGEGTRARPSSGQRRGSGRSLQLGQGGVGHSTSGSRQPAVGGPPNCSGAWGPSQSRQWGLC